MRTTVTLDDDVAAALEQLRRERGLSFKEALNAVLRSGLHPQPATHGTFSSPTASLGRQRLPDLDDVSEALAVAEGDDFR